MWPDKLDAAAKWFEARLAVPCSAESIYGPPIEMVGPLRPASVLIALIWHADAPTVLLTKRPMHMPTHAGQVSLPGGKRDSDDPDSVATALREAWEEVGLAPEQVRVLGQMERFVTITGFHVSPVVGLVVPPVEWRPDPQEVEGIFEVPLELLLNPGAYRREAFQREGRKGEYWVLDYAPEKVWGATASMLRGLAIKLQAHQLYA